MLSWAMMAVLAAGECPTRGSWRDPSLPTACEALSGKTGPAESKALEKAWGLSASSAECAVAAAHSSRRELEGTPTAWVGCVLKDPGAFGLWAALLDSPYWDLKPTHSKALADAVAALERPLPLMHQLMKDGSALHFDLVPALLAKHPDALQEVMEDPHFSGDQALEVALPLVLHFDSGGRVLTAAELKAVARAALRSALEQNELQLAAEIWARLPPAARAGVGVEALTSEKWRGADQRGPTDLRELLALSLLVVGKSDEAKALWSSTPGAVQSEESAEEVTLVRATLAFHLNKQREHPAWDLALAHTRAREFPTEALGALAPVLSPYESFLASSLRWATSERNHGREDDKGPTEAKRWRAEAHARAVERLKAVKLPASKTSAATDAGVVTLPPAPMAFTERKTPWTGAAGTRVNPETLKLPKGFWVRRAEKSGKRVVVLAASQRVDPVGEVSPGGFWLLVSQDGGQHWEELYTGLRAFRPWNPAKASAVPLLEGDTVRVEADEAPLIDKTVTFPPVSTRADPIRQHVILETTLKALRADSDGDGLTDLLEARLLLDPRKRDTDGDGLEDGRDATPRLADGATPTALAEVYNAFFEFQAGGKHRQAGIVLTPGAGNPLGDSRPSQLDDVIFLVGEPAELAGLKPLEFVVTLTEEELKAACERFGDFYPMSVEVHVSEDGKHAYLSWSEGWRGGSMRADKNEAGVWVLTSLGEWIT